MITPLTAAAALLWYALLLAPWRPWRADLVFDAQAAPDDETLAGVTALIPARNEGLVLRESLQALQAQGAGFHVIVVDDQSCDGTADIARTAGATVVAGQAVPPGWTGKLWALEQGRRCVRTEYLLLLDADVALEPGTVATLLAKMRRERIAFASVVPRPRFDGFWEKLLMPAFVYFFGLLYPFHLSNSARSRVAAASGGCILLERRTLEEIGGFAAFRAALIDDCTLARRIKAAGHRTWVGLTHSALGLRSYPRLAHVWAMVERTAYTQLHYCVAWLLACTALMMLAFWVPVIGLFYSDMIVQGLALAALVAMALSYLPTLAFYRRSMAWALTLPLIATLYLAMTWSSALRYWGHERARWKGRVYEANPQQQP